MEIAYRQTGNMPEQLQPVDVPDCMLYLWTWFCELSEGRQITEFGPGPLTYSEIMAWAILTKTDLEAWEVDVLKRIDTMYIKQAMSRSK